MNSLGALAGLRVVDRSDHLGAYCTKLLADFGADVVKVEPPEGDDLRRAPPFKDGVPHVEGSFAFAYYHQNKRGITLGRDRPESATIWAELLASADVVVASHPDVPEGRQREELLAAGCVVCASTRFGLTGPYRDARATHLTSAALGGAMVSTGDGAPPKPIPDQQLYDEAGIHAALGVLVALRNRPCAGGQLVDIAAHEVIASKGYGIHRFALSGFDELQTVGAVFPPPAATYECSDGAIEFQVVEPHQWTAFKELLGNPPELCRDDFDDRLVRHREAERINESVAALLAGKKKADVFTRAQELGVPCAPLNTLREFVDDPQTVARGTFSAVQAPSRVGACAGPRAVRASQPLLAQGRAAPTLGEHNDEVYAGELGYPSDVVARWREDGIV